MGNFHTQNSFLEVGKILLMTHRNPSAFLGGYHMLKVSARGNLPLFFFFPGVGLG